MNVITDITSSVWVAASAGSGKTKCLIDRIVAMLLNGVQPSTILCITYTRTAVAEIQKRITDQIMKLSKLSKYDLKEYCNNNDINLNSNINLNDILTRLNEDRVRIMTIHGFCRDIITRTNSDISALGSINMLDGLDQKKILYEAYLQLLQDQTLQNDFKKIIDCDGNLFETIFSFMGCIRNFLYKYDINSIEDIEIIYEKFFEKKDCTLSEYISNNVRSYLKKEPKLLFFLKEYGVLDRINNPDNYNDVLSIFLTAAGTVRKNIFPKAVLKKYNIENEICEFANLMYDINISYLQEISLNCNKSFFKICFLLNNNYLKIKRDLHKYDYEDLLYIALDFIKKNQYALFQISADLEHILIDEAQDTNSLQWEILLPVIEVLLENSKTVFIVGDSKQSIYSFQGANFAIFNQIYDILKDKCQHYKQTLHKVSLDKSYRSSASVIDFINHVFKSEFNNIIHNTARDNVFGRVEIQPLILGKDSQEAEYKLIKNIANYIQKLLILDIYLPSIKRNIQPKDIMVIFQHRGTIMKGVAKELEQLGISCDGGDLIKFKEELLIEDVISLAELCTARYDDLLFARVLRSPFFQITEQELLDLCSTKKNMTLLEHFFQNGDLYVERYRDICDKLNDYFIGFNDDSFEFFIKMLVNGDAQHIMDYHQNRKLFFDFLDFCKDYYDKKDHSLASLVAYFYKHEISIKKSVCLNDNSVHLLTAHASKGLQAPVVIIADSDFFNAKTDRILSINGFCLANNNSSQDDKTALFKKAVHEEDIQESKRLMYVALTRAEDYLIIFAKKGKVELNENCWYKQIKLAINNNENFESELTVFGGDYLVNCTNCDNNDDKINSDNISNISQKLEEFKIDIQSSYLKPSKPSRIECSSNYKTDKTIYGDFVHLLLQRLPDLSSDIWHNYAYKNNEELSYENFEKAYREAVDVLLDKEISIFFRNRIGSEIKLFNEKEFRIDMLSLISGELFIVDFKTGEKENNIDNYRCQLEKYKIYLSKIYPEYIIRTVIIWTKLKQIQEVVI